MVVSPRVTDALGEYIKNSENDQEIPQSQTHGAARKSQTTITRHQEDKLCKVPHQDDCKVSKGAKIRNLYNQVPHLTQDTNRKVINSQ